MKAKEQYKRIIKNCEFCKKEYRVFPYQEKTSRFCSFSCHGKVSRLGVRLTEETKQKISKANQGNKEYTPEVRKKMSEIKKEQFKDGITPWNKGKEMTEEYKKTVSESLTGKTGPESRNWKGGLSVIFVRKQRIAENGGSHTKGEWETLKAQYNWACPCCHKKEPEIKLSLDHIIPLAKGGSDNIENIQPLCRSCNAKKHTTIIRYELVENKC